MTSPKIIGQCLGPTIEYLFGIVIDDPFNFNSNSCISDMACLWLNLYTTLSNDTLYFPALLAKMNHINHE